MNKKNYKKNVEPKVNLDENFDFKGIPKPPEALDLEVQVLGAMMIDNLIINDVLQILSPKDFYSTRHSIIFEAALSLNQKNEPVDGLTISQELIRMGKLEDAGGNNYVVDLMVNTTTSANALHCCRLIHEKRVLRELINLSSEITTDSLDPTSNTYSILTKAERRILDISESLAKKKVICLQDSFQGLIEELGNQRQNKNALTGIGTGFTILDDYTSGFQKSELIIIAGRPSHGKTAFAMNIARNAAVVHKKSVAIFSLEMTMRELSVRMLASEAKVNGRNLKRGRLSNQEWDKVLRYYHNLKTKIYIDDSSELSVLELRAKARRLKHDHNIDMIIVDYLQLVKGQDNAERRDLEVAYVSRSLKALAKDLDIPVVACAQLNRGIEQRGKEKRPQLSDLRESGSIEQDADVVIFVHRPIMGKKRDDTVTEEEIRKAEIVIGKQRNGPTGDFELLFMEEYATFEPKSRVEQLLDSGALDNPESKTSEPF